VRARAGSRCGEQRKTRRGTVQMRLELLICVDRIAPEYLSLEAVKLVGENGEQHVARSECPGGV